ncbi:hypothetical protein MASB_44250 [Mycobacteroides abscessus subsp. bolletii BD]|nr:hypothetical protein MASB_44250 [Mycobacteroides abscessus subsp. bolletii BD]
MRSDHHRPKPDRSLTVATIGEAEIFAAAGFADLFIAYPRCGLPVKRPTVCAMLRIKPRGG